jgi:UrcA family protein
MNTATLKLTYFRRSLALAGACAALSLSTVSFATPPSDATPSVAVRFDDLNLATSAGVETLYRRISHAAQSVCPVGDIRDLALISASERCQAQAVSRAVNELHNPKLAVLHAARASQG